MAIQDKALLANLEIRKWGATKIDQRASAFVHAEFGSQEQVGRFVKNLIPKREMDDINNAAASARAYHYKMTLPWIHSGPSILPTERFIEYKTGMEEIKRRFDGAITRFIDGLPGIIAMARQAHGDLWRDEDMPSTGEIKDIFYMGVKFTPVPRTDDVRTTLSEFEQDEVRKELKTELDEATKLITRANFSRMAKVVNTLIDRLDRYDPTDKRSAPFRDSLVANIRDLVEVMPSMNLTDDPNIESICEEIGNKLAVFEPDTLRKVENIRTSVKEQAEDIAKKISIFL